MMKRTFIHLCCGAALLATTACSNQEDVLETNVMSFGTIQVGGLLMNNGATTMVTRADDETSSSTTQNSDVTNTVVDAESLPWLKTALENGLEITYAYGTGFDEKTGAIKEGKKALLKYTGSKYTFTYIDKDNADKNQTPAEWLGNGFHVFQGFFIPEKLFGGNITGGVENRLDIFENQSNEGNDNYDKLSQYTCMPIFPKSKIAATVNQISLPFQHRLSRVIVQVVIDDEIKSDYNNPDSPKAQIQGYSHTDAEGKTVYGGKDCSLRFCGVKVLKIVDKDNRPSWIDDSELKVIPHFLEERAKIKVAQKDDEGNVKLAVNGTDTLFTEYTHVPTFDVIVRPTYYKVDTPMPDEQTDEESDQKLMDEKNSISFTVTLDNGMIYKKTVEFDLNPNEQTTITLIIEKEGVNVNDAGTNNWITDKFHNDDYYGIDNTLGHNLSKAGSCWQRAYQISDKQYDVTDGSNPKDPENDDRSNDTQYLTKEKFIEYLKEAKKDETNGKHHGDYFILTGDLELPSDWEPFEFTGHLDGRHYKVTLPGSQTSMFSALNGNYDETTYTIDGELITANIHKDVNGNTYPMVGYRAEILNLYLTNKDASLVSGKNTGFIYNCHTTGEGKFCGENEAPGQVVDCTQKKN